MDPIALAAALQSYGPWGLLAVSLLVNKVLYDRSIALQTKVEDTLKEWRTDSAAQGDKLVELLERAAEKRSR